MTLLRLLMTGGYTIIVLIVCSIISLGIIIERFLYYRSRSLVMLTDFMPDVRREMDSDNAANALKICEPCDTPFSRVALVGLGYDGSDRNEISAAMERSIIVQTNLLQRRTAIVGTIGSTAVYIGLFGTVLGIIRAFMDISTSGTGGINVVSKGISESLVCTAAGLIVAVPAVMAYNYFMKKIGDFITDMELCASEVMGLKVRSYGQKIAR